VDIPSLFGDLLLDGVVHWCDRRGWGLSGGSHRSRWDVGFACRYWWLSRWDKRLLGGNCRLAWRWGGPPGRWGDPPGRRGGPPGRRGGFGCCCGWCFGDNREDSLLSHWWAGGGGPPVILIRDVVVMIWRQFAWSRGVNNHLWNGWNHKRMQIEHWNMSTYKLMRHRIAD